MGSVMSNDLNNQMKKPGGKDTWEREENALKFAEARGNEDWYLPFQNLQRSSLTWT